MKLGRSHPQPTWPALRPRAGRIDDDSVALRDQLMELEADVHELELLAACLGHHPEALLSCSDALERAYARSERGDLAHAAKEVDRARRLCGTALTQSRRALGRAMSQIRDDEEAVRLTELSQLLDMITRRNAANDAPPVKA